MNWKKSQSTPLRNFKNLKKNWLRRVPKNKKNLSRVGLRKFYDSLLPEANQTTFITFRLDKLFGEEHKIVLEQPRLQWKTLKGSVSLVILIGKYYYFYMFFKTKFLL